MSSTEPPVGPPDPSIPPSGSTPPPPSPEPTPDPTPAAPSYGTPPPPPPAGGEYGAPPPPPPPPAGPGSSSGWNLGDALNYGWTKFQANIGQIIIAAIVLLVGIVVLGIIGGVIQAAATSTGSCSVSNSTGNLECTDGTGFVARLIINALVTALILIVAQVVGAGLIRGSLGITDGRPFLVSEVFKTDKLGPVIVTSLIIAAATFVGTLLCYFPGLIIGFLTSYSLYFVIDKNLAPVEAIKASVDLTRQNLGDTLIWYIVGGIVAVVGFVVCLVGALVSVPIVLIGTAFTYKKLTGQAVAA